MPQAESFASDPVTGTVRLDGGPGRYRIGLVVLGSDYATERDFMNMRAGMDGTADDVAIYTSRVRNINPVTIENLRKMSPLLGDSADLLIPEGRLDVVAYSCTSATVAIGYDGVAGAIREARPGIPVVTPLTAAQAALKVLGARRIAVLTPYIDDVNRPMAAVLESSGLEIAAFTAFQMEDDNDMARIPPEAIHDAALQADRPEAEALFISCTAIRSVDVVARIEESLGKPVVTSNQAMFWHSLRQAGCQEPVSGYGRLPGLPL